MIGRLPTTLEIGGTEYSIRTDFRDALPILAALGDPELDDKQKLFVMLFDLYEDFEDIPQDDYEEAVKKANWFLNGGQESEPGSHPRVMDWEQDEALIFPAVNNVAGFETRSAEYVHWWTFLGYFMEVHDGVFSQVMSLRQKKAKGKKLEKWEQEFWRNNKRLCVLERKRSQAEKDLMAELNALLD